VTIILTSNVVYNFTAFGAEYKNSYGTFVYTESNNKITIIGYKGTVSRVYVPSKIEGKSVVKIASKAFNSKYIKNIMCTSAISSIEKDAFYNCKNLTYVYLNPHINVNANAFTNCQKLNAITCKSNSGLWNKQKGKVMLISAIMNKDYTGKKITPIPIVNYYGKALKINKAFKVSYTNNVKYGVAKCKIRFISSYKALPSKTISFDIRPSKTLCSSVSVNNGELQINWEQKNNADGYYVTYSTDSNFTQNSHTELIKGKATTSYTHLFSSTELKENTLYYIKVQSYKIYNGVTYKSYFSYDKVRVYPNDEISSEETYEPLNYDVMKGMWISYIDFNLTDRTFAGFKKRFDSIVNNCKSNGYNTLIVQVRPFNDALYYSDYFPYSHIISGEQGKDPNYDALEYMVTCAHSKGLSIHAWINPYRVSINSMPSKLSADNPYSLNSALGVKWGSGIYLNPAKKATEDLIVKGIVELMKNYNIDGIQFDDYFYPTTSKFFDSTQYEEYKNSTASPLTLSAWRKNNINSMVKRVYSTVKSINENVQFGISPQGNYDNNASLYADVKAWCTKKGYVDYICPQIYWSLTNPTLKYENAIIKWKQLKFHSDLKFYVGLSGYKAGSKTEDNGTWKNKTTILRQEYLIAMNNYFANGVMVFRYNYLNSAQSKKEFQNLATVLKSN
jgi:uncharacterized lipoprotein YddW (UPF0748 family)